MPIAYNAREFWLNVGQISAYLSCGTLPMYLYVFVFTLKIMCIPHSAGYSHCKRGRNEHRGKQHMPELRCLYACSDQYVLT